MVDFPTALSLFTTFASFEWASVDDKQALAFCIGTGLMSKTTDDFSTSQCPQRLKRYLLKPLYEPENAPELSIENPEMLLQKYVEAIMAVGVFATLLRDNISRGFILSPHRFKHPGLPPTALIVPNAKDIPFLSMMDLPLPFALTTPRELATCHLPKMTSREFLEDGEWIGFYSISRQIEERVSFDPPMHGIRFSASANDDCPTILYLHATGKDGVDPFDLDGLVEQKSGKVMLTKRYNQFNIWYWSSIMTPYGIVGTWGSRGYGGWVWLWKVGWTNDALNTDAGPLLEEPKQTAL